MLLQNSFYNEVRSRNLVYYIDDNCGRVRNKERQEASTKASRFNFSLHGLRYGVCCCSWCKIIRQYSVEPENTSKICTIIEARLKRDDFGIVEAGICVGGPQPGLNALISNDEQAKTKGVQPKGENMRRMGAGRAFLRAPRTRPPTLPFCCE